VLIDSVDARSKYGAEIVYDFYMIPRVREKRTKRSERLAKKDS
jgi:hypothetical protein